MRWVEIHRAFMAKAEQQATVLTTGGATMRWLSAAICLAVLSPTTTLLVKGAPILGPDLDTCVWVIPPFRTAADAENCCLSDTGKPIKNFKFDPNLPMRVRRPVHKLDEEFVQKYERAYELIRDLPPEDPRSFISQAKLHCAYCGGAYSQFNFPETFDVHASWLTMPFHRWYLYFHERILASLIGDDTFAIPYWAWDVHNETSPPANVMPVIFLNETSSLYDPLRSNIHRPPNIVDLEHQSVAHNKDPEVQKRINYNIMSRAMTGGPGVFHGGKFSLGDKLGGRGGEFEMGAHLAVHSWTGSETQPAGENMGPPYAAARDPIFFTHHSQVDRLWLTWKRIGGQDYDDPDWLDAEYLFYDEHGDMVRVNIRDSLDIEKLRISYEDTPPDWLDYTPKSIRDTDPNYATPGILRRLWRQVLARGVFGNLAVQLRNFLQLEESMTDVILGGGRAVVSSRVSRPEVSSQRTTMEHVSGINMSRVNEVLVVSGVVTKPWDTAVLFKLFMELPEANENTPLDCVEYLGSSYFAPEGLRDGQETTVAKEFNRVVGIGDRLKILDISQRNSVTLTFVSAWNPKDDSHVSVRLTGLRIELQ